MNPYRNMAASLPHKDNPSTLVALRRRNHPYRWNVETTWCDGTHHVVFTAPTWDEAWSVWADATGYQPLPEEQPQ